MHARLCAGIRYAQLPGHALQPESYFQKRCKGQYCAVDTSLELCLNRVVYTLVPRATLRGVAEVHVASGMPQWRMFVTCCYF